MRWLAHTHAMRWHVAHGTVGRGHLYQGRFKAFPIQEDEHFLSVCRYVERNAMNADCVPVSIPVKCFSGVFIAPRLRVGRPRSRDFLDTLMERGVVSKKSVVFGHDILTRGPGTAGIATPKEVAFPRFVKINCQGTMVSYKLEAPASGSCDGLPLSRLTRWRFGLVFPFGPRFGRFRGQVARNRAVDFSFRPRKTGVCPISLRQL